MNMNDVIRYSNAPMVDEAATIYGFTLMGCFDNAEHLKHTEACEVWLDRVEFLATHPHLSGDQTEAYEAWRKLPIADDGDNLRLCRICRDRDTTSADSVCWVCRQQQMIDED